MKKIFCFVIFVSFFLSVSACSVSNSSKNDAEPTTMPQSTSSWTDDSKNSQDYAEAAVKDLLSNAVSYFTYEIQDVYVKKDKSPTTYSSDPDGLGDVVFSFENTVCRVIINYTVEGTDLMNCIFFDKDGKSKSILWMDEDTIRSTIGSMEEVRNSAYSEAIITTYVLGYQTLYANSFPESSELDTWDHFSGDQF